MPKNPRHLILNLLLGRGGEPLTASEAVASCALFGISENSTRVALARLAAAALVGVAGRGAYVLGPKAAGLAADVALWRGAEQRVIDWSGAWIAVHVAGLGRSNRAATKARERALGLLGLQAFERGLHLRPDNQVGGVVAVRARLLKLGLEAEALVFVARDLDPVAEKHACALWQGPVLTRHYRDTGQRLATWLAAAGSLAPDVAAREAFSLGHDAIRSLVFDPLLPAPLVDVAARREFADTVARFDAAGHALWRRFFDAQQAGSPPRAAARGQRLRAGRHPTPETSAGDPHERP